ncbi:TPA: MFS transporter [Escherichia coli]|nr:MFS transporter [Escherichia coli]
MTIEKHERSTKDLVKAAVSGWLGTALEFMDFQLYSLGAALVFHEIFFPESSTAMALILAMGTYGAGYVARIVGAFIFGKMGDRIGRKKVLFITITMMGICTTLIGVLPTYAQIGVFAPILLVTLRIIQGLGAGAEISGAGTMLAEYAPKGKRGIISSFVAMGTNCGTLSATAIWAFMFFILSKEELLAWGWRIPFLASVVVMVFAIWLRLNLKESPVFEKVNDSNQPTAKPAPAGSMFQSKSFWLATGLRFGQAGNSGLIQTFLAGYLVQTLLFNKAIPTDALMISSILGFMTIPFLGWLSDKIGRRIPYIIMNTSAIVLFRQWVIEDNFVAGRPEWEKAGAELVSDVLPYEEMKLRMLNGSHSFLAYLGYLAGYQHINDCMEDEHYRHAAYALMLLEQAPTLKVQGVDLQDYANRLIERYSNPALRHRTWQIAMDGSQKLPQRMLDSVRWHLAHDSKFDLLALGVAGWMRYVGGVDEQGNPIEISDPLLPVIQKAVQSSAEGTARVQSLLAIKAIFGDDLPDNSLFTTKVTEAYLSLLAHGAKATVAKYSVK